MRHLLLIALVWFCMATPDSVRAEPVSGAGSTFVYPLLGHWAERFRTTEADGGDFPAPESGLDYEPVGSLAGTMRVIARAVDFGASDAPLAAADVDRHGLAQFPITMGGVAVAVNLPGIESGALRLSGSALAGIYLGTIAKWSDPALAALNPELRLPDAPITVVHRSDGSGTTYNFAAYLAHASTPWRERVGVDTELKWPAGTGAKGSAGMMEAVRKTQNAIGYVEFGQALRVGLATVRIENRAGQFVAPSRDSIAAAGASVDWAAARHFDRLLTEAAGLESYPIAATVFALMPRERAGAAGARRALRFFEGGVTRWQQDAAELGYVPLPDPLVTQVRSYWTAMVAGHLN